MKRKSIFVTKPLLPDLDAFHGLLGEIWQSGVVTNSGKMHNNLEKELAVYLGVPYISLFNNGTIALLVALKALGLPGGSEIITTPYSFVATAHAIVWGDFIPVFVDVDQNTCNIDIGSIEDAITENTSAIMGVHCYGNPCDVAELDKLAQKYNLKVVYDAAHAFGVNVNGKSVLNFGDLSSLSFHATKVFNTIEGGAIVSKTLEMKKKIDSLKNFGFQDEVTVTSLGINGKLNEVNSAFGLLQLADIDNALAQRRIIDRAYRSRLVNLKNLKLLDFNVSATVNGSYFPVFVQSLGSHTRDEIYQKFRAENIYVRRYFYPLITEMEPYLSNCKYHSDHDLTAAKKLADEVLCLPIYPDLSLSDVDTICDFLWEWLGGE